MALLDELAAREAAIRWLDERTQLGTQPVRQPDVASFPFRGQLVSLLLRQQGICKPRQLGAERTELVEIIDAEIIDDQGSEFDSDR